MQNVKMLQRSLKQKLTRGAKVVIGESYPEPEMRGKEMVLASKSVVRCMGKGRCAHDNCIGLAAFVTEPGKLLAEKGKGDKNIGWRADTTKICLTHLRTPEGEELVPEQEEEVGEQANGSVKPTNRIQERLETREETPTTGYVTRREETPTGSHARSESGVNTSWEALAQAASARDLDAVVRIARALKTETDGLRQKLMDTQDRLLSRLGG